MFYRDLDDIYNIEDLGGDGIHGRYQGPFGCPQGW
jgi:hypothetical protein